MLARAESDTVVLKIAFFSIQLMDNVQAFFHSKSLRAAKDRVQGQRPERSNPSRVFDQIERHISPPF